jgi:cell wall-associated NlpC family hydrolase
MGGPKSCPCLPAHAALGRARFAENFSLSAPPGEDCGVRTLPLVLLGATLALSTACTSTRQQSLPSSALIARAWAGAEPQTTPEAMAVVWFAASQVGKPYCWGGTGPSCFDCSGLAQTAWRHVGIRLPRTAHGIATSLPEVPLSEVRAGDILWWPGHVGIYAGNGWVVDALDTRHGVVRRPASDPHRAFRPLSEFQVWPNAGPEHAALML